jgi:hypothetical protein
VTTELKDLFVRIPVVEFIDRETSHLKEVCFLRFDLEATAVRLDHVEVLRRLDELNHAHAQNMIDKQDYLPRQMFEQWAKENATWRESVTKSISESTGSNRTLIVLVGFIFSAITILLHFWK